MSPGSIYDAIDAKMLTFSLPGATIGLLNVEVVPTAGVPYVVCSMPAYVRRSLTLGTDASFVPSGYLAEHRGTFRVEVVIPQGMGRPLATNLQGQLLRLFPRGTTLIGSDGAIVNFDAPTPLPLITQEAWLRAPVNCPWWSFEAS